uniref:Nuclear receptor domain-containing protein n=1 Tax=Panagrellus redivivus TaxID=6233 RepID=A0A7E4WBQ7_PANRE
MMTESTSDDNASPEYVFCDDNIEQFTIIMNDDDGPNPKNCLVCGDPTKCYHYDVPSCSGCKTFFRRTVISGRSYGCKNKGKCLMKGKGRCRQCRFDKCVTIGMNPAAIALPKNVDLELIIQRVENRKRALLSASDVISLPSASASPEAEAVVPVKIVSNNLPQQMEYRDVDFLLFLESKVKKLRESSYNPPYMYTMRLKDFIMMDSELGKSDRYGNDTSWPITRTQKSYPNYGNTEKKPVIKHWLALDLFLNVDMAKTLPIFEQWEPNDKTSFVINAVVSTALLTQGYYSHEKHSDVVVFPDGFQLLWLAKSSELNKLETEIFVRIVQPIKRIDLTKEEYVLLKAIIFCNPAFNNISDAGQELLEKESERYTRTLLRYMQSIHGDSKGASRYAQVLQITEAMTYFAERNRDYQLIRCIRSVQEKVPSTRPPIFIVDESFQI